MKCLKWISVVVFLGFSSVFAAEPHRVTGAWKGSYWNRAMAVSMQNPIELELRLDGDVVEGVLLAGRDRLPIEAGRFSPEDEAIHFEVFFPGNGLRYVADGTVGEDEIRGQWRHERADGTFQLRREEKQLRSAPSELLHSAEVRRLHSAALQGDLRFTVYLPPSYYASPQPKYPVVYFLHGLFEDDHSWEHRGIAGIVDRLRAEGKLGEFIVVAPNGKTGFWLDGKERGDAYHTAVVRDLMSEIRRSYRVDESLKPALLGVSMGGYGTLLFALKDPERFSGVAVINPALFEEIPTSTPRERVTQALPELTQKLFGEPFDREHYETNNPLWVLKREPLRARTLRMPLYIAQAKEDPYGFVDGTTAFHRLLDQAGLNHRFVTFAGSHEWESMRSVLPEAIVFLWKALTEADAAGPRDPAASEQLAAATATASTRPTHYPALRRQCAAP